MRSSSASTTDTAVMLTRRRTVEEGVRIYPGNYLDMYWAGVTAYKMGKRTLAREWIDKAIAANPSYEPAIDFRDRNLEKKKK